MRLFLTLTAAVSIVMGLWLIIPEILLLSEGSKAQDNAGTLTRTKIAAEIAVIRGDLWGQAAREAMPIGTLPPTASSQGASENHRDARVFAERSIAKTPLDTNQWLILAWLDQLAQAKATAVSALTMAYFTGAGDPDHAGTRLDLAGQILPLDQADSCDLIRGDLAFLLQDSGGGATAVRAAYAHANPVGRSCFDGIAATMNPAFTLSGQ